MSTAADHPARDLLQAGHDALARHAWAEARAWFELARGRAETPAALEGLARAAAHLGDTAAAMTARARAYQLYHDAGDHRAAARLATRLALEHQALRHQPAMATYWLRRAQYLLDGVEPGAEHGGLALAAGQLALLLRHDRTEAERCGAEAAELGRRFGLPELERAGLALQRRARADAGVAPAAGDQRPAATARAVAAPPAAVPPAARRRWRSPSPRRWAVLAAGLAVAVVVALGVGRAQPAGERPEATAGTARTTSTVAILAAAPTPAAPPEPSAPALPATLGATPPALAAPATAAAMGAGPSPPTPTATATSPPGIAGRATAAVVFATATSGPRPEGLVLTVTVVGIRSWLEVRVDGAVAFTGVMEPGVARAFAAREEITVHAGRADSIEVALDGAPLGRLGQPGQDVVRRTFRR